MEPFPNGADSVSDCSKILVFFSFLIDDCFMFLLLLLVFLKEM